MPVIPPGMVFDPNGVEILSLYLPMLIDNGGKVVACLGEFSDLIKAEATSDLYSAVERTLLKRILTGKGLEETCMDQKGVAFGKLLRVTNRSWTIMVEC
ncbi:hypothetical protein V6N11_019387 [Hibiscus sabdariffa]|uniref:Uncharacterized protein n=1 Tax=Hibiscus sabdariffa TaxID=183260 RepID=A0ABR2R2R2_9ROSI